MFSDPEGWHCRIGNVAGDPAVLMRRDGASPGPVVQECNAAFQRLFDVTREEARGLSLHAISDLLGVEQGKPALGSDAMQSDSVVWSSRQGSRMVQGKWHGLLASTGPQGAGPIWSVHTLRDVTEMRRMEDALRVTRDIADGQGRTKSEFLANMSHELRTPLNAILGYSEVLRDPGSITLTDARRSAYAGNIHQAGSHLLQLIEDLLELSRMEAGQRKFHEEPVALSAILEEACDWAVRNAGTGPDSASVSVAVPDMHVLADATAMRQILINLIGNALKFSPAGQPVIVAADRRDDGTTVVTVTDRGPGIPLAQIERMFEPFRQGESALSKRHGGAGLGLAIVRALAERHGGSAHLKSMPGQGTEAVVSLPPGRSIPAPALVDS
jgi:signal transduction histidine kinase